VRLLISNAGLLSFSLFKKPSPQYGRLPPYVGTQRTA